MTIWFEKKPGKEYSVVAPSCIYGPHAVSIAESLAGIGIPSNVLAGEEELLFERVLKNVFVFTLNIAGLAVEEGTTAEGLWTRHNELVRDIE